MNDLLDIRMNDGSRHFVSLPATQDWYSVRDHVSALPGAQLTNFVCDGITEAWIDFTFQGESFSVNDQFSKYLFFVANPSCADDVLSLVDIHWTRLLASTTDKRIREA